MISVKNLKKSYGSFEAVKDVSFEVAKGELCGLLGPNGAGKTTTMRILTCYLAPTAGTASVAGFDILENPQAVRKNIGYMPENPPVYLDMTVERFLTFVAEIKEVPKLKIRASVNEAMEKVKITPMRKRLIGHLSRGYRQRVGLAQALVHQPAVLILDEPTLGLDPTQIIEIRELIRSLRGHHTVILSSHILSEVQASCSQVVIINHGKIAALDRVERISQNQTLKISFKTANFNAEEFEQDIRQSVQVKNVRLHPLVEDGISSFSVEFEGNPLELSENVSRTAQRHQWLLVELHNEPTSLEQVFMKAISTHSLSLEGGVHG